MKKEAFCAKWLETFGGDISRNDIKKHVASTGNYIWHVFSWELLGDKRYLSGEAAKRAYDSADKRGAIYIDWFQDDHTKDITRAQNVADALDAFTEVYVVGKDFKWTYIKTHEGGFGPYFLERK